MIYYVEVNLIAIIVGLLLLYNTRSLTSKRETSQIVMNIMLVILVVFSISDISAYYFRGKSHLGVEISNIVFFILMAAGAYAWFIYICVKMLKPVKLKKTLIISSVPIVLLSVAIALNHLTEFFFTIDSDNIYHRNTGVLLTWVVEWGYVLAALVINIVAIAKENKSFKKHEYRGYIYFFIPLAIAAVVQMLFYGTTTSQIGFMVSLFMAYSNRQFHLVHKDELTGLNNKNAFLNYRDYLESNNRDTNITILMMDADNFKSINDNYGHLKGDKALKDVADALRAAAAKFKTKRVILYRYAGDEFVVVGTDLSSEEVETICELIHGQISEINEKNEKHGEKYKLGLSIGYASAVCNSVSEFDALLRKADEVMYEVKKKKRVGR